MQNIKSNTGKQKGMSLKEFDVFEKYNYYAW